MKRNYFQKTLFFLIFISIILFVILPATQGETQAAQEIQESEEFENSLVRNVQNDYRNGFRELLKFINSLNDTLTSLNAKLAPLDTALNAQNTKMDAGFNDLNERLSTTLNAKVDKISRKTNLLLSHAFPKLTTWEGFDTLIRAQAKEIKTGKTFNGSTLSDIKSRASQVGYKGRHTAIVFVNHLDEAIGDFTIYDRWNFLYTPPPNSVPRRTQEIFTSAAPTYNDGTYGVGLAFVSKGADMKTYYESHRGIEGSTVWELSGWMDRNLSVGYKNLYARVFADHEENYKSTLRIELIQLPLDD